MRLAMRLSVGSINAEFALMAFAPISRAFLIACLVTLSSQPVRAAVACPILLVDGQLDQQGIELTFRNSGKLPIQQLDLDCTLLRAGAARRACHTETGIFFPGTPYTIRFFYPSAGARSILISLNAARLSDGYRWTWRRDRSCRPLRILRNRRR